jgi:alpha-D-ribose 1-methylphosphonate 5-triphosphate synthase subunit PhnL
MNEKNNQLNDNLVLDLKSVCKSFTLHARNGAHFPVFSHINLKIRSGECLALTGHSGSGKSSLMRCLYGNYRVDSGSVQVRHDGYWLDMAQAAPRLIMDIRRQTIGYVSQFLRVIPRVSALDVVAEPLRRIGVAADLARERAADLLTRLNLPEYLWHLPPATFSGGEQQRVNIAHGLVIDRPILLLDEPTASLDANNRRCVINLIQEAKMRGVAIVGIFHDDEIRQTLATHYFDVEAHKS